MTFRTKSLAGIALAVALTAGCGGGAKLAAGQIAVVCDRPVTQAQFDALIRQAEAGYKLQKQPFPAEGSPRFDTIKQHMIELLVGRTEQRAAARKLGIHVSAAQLAASEEQLLGGQFHGDRKAFLRYFRQQGMTEGDIRDLLASNLFETAIANRLTRDLAVTDAEIRAYYRANQALYRSHRTRPVREILVKSRARAAQLAAQARSGGDFAALARRFSADPAAKRTGGATTLDEGALSRGDSRAVFTLPVGKVSAPFRLGVVWAIVQPTGPIAPGTTIPLARVRTQIAQYLLAHKRQDTIGRWMNDVKTDCAKGARYADGYRPTG